MANFILLTGAGFSRNWGGWLANEAFEYLLGSGLVDDRIRRLLWDVKNKGRGFEDALATLQADCSKDRTLEQQLAALSQAIWSMFAAMANGYKRLPFEFVDDPTFSIITFLGRFHAIYTLNQDDLIEHHFIRHPIAGKSAACPGLTPQQEGTALLGTTKIPIFEPATSDFKLGHFQPYIKLHGSFNWVQEDRRLLILGGGKAKSISQFPLLSWYHDLFRADLKKPDTRLMVIGYSFGDDHINAAIQEACVAGNLRVVIIDPAGVDVLDKRNPKAQIGQPPPPLLENVGLRVIGASRRGLREIFGGDFVEHAKVMRFFSG